MVERSERRWVWIFALVIMLVTTAPYLLAYSRQGADWRYTGFLFGVEDGNSYIAKMLTGSSGDWLFRTPYTAYPQNGALVFVLYILLGKLAAPPGLHEQLVALFHLARIAAGMLAIAAVYDFAALFISGVRWRRWATVLAALGGGFGWLSVLGFNSLWKAGLPLEFYSPETFGFLSLFGLPHLALARAFLLWGLRDYLIRRDRLLSGRALLRAALVWLVVLATQPMIVVIGWAVMAVHLALTGLWQLRHARSGRSADWERFRVYFYNALRTGVVTGPFVLAIFLSFQFDPFMNAWKSQTILTSPPFVEYILGYGVLLPLAIWGASVLLRSDPWHSLLLVGWVALIPVLVYAPIESQRRMIEGVWVAVCILGAAGLAQVRPGARRWAYAWTALAFPATLFLFLGATMAAANPSTPMFRPASEVRAFQYLAENARKNDVVLATNSTSNAIPAWAPVRTIIGLGPESINGPAIREQVDCFYAADCTDSQRQALIQMYDIRYIIAGPQERLNNNETALSAWNPGSAPYLQLVFEEGDYQVYRYKPGP